jgi:hypothetical protein
MGGLFGGKSKAPPPAYSQPSDDGVKLVRKTKHSPTTTPHQLAQAQLMSQQRQEDEDQRQGLGSGSSDIALS